MTRYAMSIDLERCLGCGACLVACKTENEVGEGTFRLRMEEHVAGEYPSLRGEFWMLQCFHCQNPACVRVCPTGATFQRPDGVVAIDATRCVGCKACIQACPYSMRFLNAEGHAEKCTFCEHRIAQGEVPACVQTCPAQARVFGDLDDPEGALRQALDAASRSETWQPRAGAEPRLYYLNSQLLGGKAR